MIEILPCYSMSVEIASPRSKSRQGFPSVFWISAKLFFRFELGGRHFWGDKRHFAANLPSESVKVLLLFAQTCPGSEDRSFVL